MRRDHPRSQQHEDPLLSQLSAQYAGRVAPGLIEAGVAALDADGQDRLSAEQLLRAQVASLAASGRLTSARRRR